MPFSARLPVTTTWPFFFTSSSAAALPMPDVPPGTAGYAFFNVTQPQGGAIALLYL